MQPVTTFDSTSFPDSHSAYTVPVSWSTVIPPGIVLQPESGIALFVPASIGMGGPNVAPPSTDVVTYTRSSGVNVWNSRYTLSLLGSDAVGVLFFFGYTSIQGRSDAPGWLSASLFCVVHVAAPLRLR